MLAFGGSIPSKVSLTYTLKPTNKSIQTAANYSDHRWVPAFQGGEIHRS